MRGGPAPHGPPAQLPWGPQPGRWITGAMLGDRREGSPLPERPAPHATHLLAAGIVTELVIAGMQGLPRVDGIEDHLVPHDHLWGQVEPVRAGRAGLLALASVCPSENWTCPPPALGS